MGHYASEMAGPGPTEEENRNILEQRRQELQSRWDNGLRMTVAYPYSHDQYTCPQCYALIELNFLIPHDGWHQRLKAMSLLGPGLF